MEILAPVNAETLDAAIAAGADAVYFGLKRLNARRGAKNFSQAELPAVVAKLHAAGIKAHLTINIDLDTREIGLAARMLQLAQESGVDAVIIRDPAILSLREYFPGLEFHLSTQAGISSSAGVAAAKRLGCQRAVLARELTREGIAAAAALPGIATEVFIQGAMCFSCSGRCLLSSWIGGRSGNRGACASPCRLPWRSGLEGAEVTHPLSMQDLCLLEKMSELESMGVASAKIEGRLKNAEWVSRAIRLYKHAASDEEVQALGNYTGRTLTEGYYAHQFENLTENAAGRTKTAAAPAPVETAETEDDASELLITVDTDVKAGTILEFSFGGAKDTFRIPPQHIANPRRAAELSAMIEEALDTLPRMIAASAEVQLSPEVETRLLPRRCASQIADALQNFLRAAARSDRDDGTIRLAIRPELADAIAPDSRPLPAELRRHRLGDPVDRVRFALPQLPWLQAHLAECCPGNTQLIVQVTSDCTPQQLTATLSWLPQKQRQGLILALPAVIYEEELDTVRGLCRLAREEQWLLEVNSWDTLELARENGNAFETGAGLAVLNPQAAAFLSRQGAQCCMVSPEIDREQLELLCQNTATPLSLTIFARPALMVTRARLPEEFAPLPDGRPGMPFTGPRGIRLAACKEGALTALRPEIPYDWRRLSNNNIAVAHMTADYIASPAPAEDAQIPPKNAPLFRFNYDRELK